MPVSMSIIKICMPKLFKKYSSLIIIKLEQLYTDKKRADLDEQISHQSYDMISYNLTIENYQLECCDLSCGCNAVSKHL